MASEWLKRAARESQKRIDKKYGAEAYGGSEYEKKEQKKQQARAIYNAVSPNIVSPAVWVNQQMGKRASEHQLKLGLERQRSEDNSWVAEVEALNSPKVKYAGKTLAELEEIQKQKDAEHKALQESSDFIVVPSDAANNSWSNVPGFSGYSYDRSISSKGSIDPTEAALQVQRLSRSRKESDDLNSYFEEQKRKEWSKKQADTKAALEARAKMDLHFGERVSYGKELNSAAKNQITKSNGRGDDVLRYINDSEYKEWLGQYLKTLGEDVPAELLNLDYLTEDEKGIIRYYATKHDRGEMLQYIDSLDLNARRQSAINEETYKQAREHPWLSAFKNILASPGQVAGYLETLHQSAENKKNGDRYKPIDLNTPGFDVNHYVAQSGAGIHDEAYLHGGKFGAGAADFGVSLGQSAITLPLGPVAGPIVQGAAAAGGGTFDALSRGASANQALGMGTISGLSSALSEAIPTSRLFKGMKNVPKTLSDKLAFLGVQAIEEGVSGGADSFVNSAADKAIMKEKSRYAELKAQYIERGMSEGDAAYRAGIQIFGIDVLKDAGSEALAGVLMAGGFSAVGTAIAKSNERSRTRDTRKRMTDEMNVLVDALNNEIAGINSEANYNLIALPTPEQKIRAEQIEARRKETVAKKKALENNREAIIESGIIANRFGARLELTNAVETGSYKDGIITLNPYMANPVREVMVHELTHHFEQSGEYKALSDYVLGVLDKRGVGRDKLIDATIKAYAKNDVILTSEGAEHELVAKWCSENLFDKGESIKKLSGVAPGLFRSTYDWIADSVVRLRGLGAEADLNRALRLYENTARSEHTGNSARDTQYAIMQDADGDLFVDIPNPDITTLDRKDLVDALKDIVETKYNDWVNAKGQKIGINKKTANEWVNSRKATKLYNSDTVAYTDKINTFSYADELLQASREYIGEEKKHSRKDNFVEFARGKVNFRVGTNGYNAEVIVGITKKQTAILYDIINLSPTKIADAPVYPATATQNVNNRRTGTSANGSVSQPSRNIKSSQKYSDMSLDEIFAMAESEEDLDVREDDIRESSKRDNGTNPGEQISEVERDARPNQTRGEGRESGAHEQAEGSDFGRGVDGTEKEYPHLYDESKVSRAFIESVNPEIENAIISIRNGNLESVPDVIEVAELSDETIERISDFVGFDIGGYSCKIDKDALVHIDRRHGINGEHDKNLSDPKDIARLGYVLENFDDIDWIRDNHGNVKVMKKYKDRHNNKAPLIMISCKIDGTYCVSQVVPDAAKRTIWVTSARIQKADAKNQVPNDSNAIPRPQTSETPLGSSSASDNIVPQDTDIVKDSMSENEGKDTASPLPIAEQGEKNRNAIPLPIGERNTSSTAEAVPLPLKGKAKRKARLRDIPGILNAKKLQTVTAKYSASAARAQALADERGLKLCLFVGGNLQIGDDTSSRGRLISAKGYIIGNRVYVRADDPNFTAEQIMRHEVGHDKIRRGEIDIGRVRKRIREKFPGREEQVAALYEAAYEGSGMTEKEIWEEIICDSLGDMNIFYDTDGEQAMDTMLPMVKESAEESTGEATRAPPMNEGKFSISPALRSELQAVLDNTFDKSKNEVLIGTTSEFLVNTLGASPLRVTMPANKAYAAMVSEQKARADGRYESRLNYHGLGKNLLSGALAASENPIAAFVDTNEIDEKTGKTKDRSDHIVLVTDKQHNGSNIIVIMQVDTSGLYGGRRFKVNKDITVYDRETVASDIVQAAHEGRLLHLDKKRSHTLSAGVQAANSPAAIRKVDFKENIARFWDNVKWKKSGKPSVFKSVDTNTETDMERAYREALERKEGHTSIVLDRETVQRASEKYIEKYGAFPKGEKAYRDIEVPKKTGENSPVMRHARTVMEAKAIPDELVGELMRSVIDGEFTYEPISNKTALSRAKGEIEFSGFEAALEKWRAIASGNVPADKNGIALGEYILTTAAENNLPELALRTAQELSALLTQAGQTVQAAQLLKSMTPEGRLYTAQKSLDFIKREYAEHLKKGKVQLEIPAEIASEILNAKSKGEIEAAEEHLSDYIAANIPATIVEKWNNWRYMAMLTNPRTHIRNTFGNAVMYVVRRAKDIAKLPLEVTYTMIDPSAQHTRSAALFTRKEDRAYAREEYEIAKQILGEGEKYGGAYIEKKRKVFNTKWLEAIRKFNSNLLEGEDNIFMRASFVSAYAQKMKAQKYTSEFLSSDTKEAQAARLELREAALEEALKATFRDASRVANWLKKATKVNPSDSLGLAFAKGAVEGVVPFKQTPVNIVKRGIEYSPAEILIDELFFSWGRVKNAGNGLTSAADIKLAKQKQIARELDKLASGFVGSGVCVLGWFLAQLGVLRFKIEDEEKLLGKQDFSLEAYGYSITLDWLSPTAMPLFIGAAISDIVVEQDANFLDALKLLPQIIEPISQMSMLSSFEGLLSAVTGSDQKLPDALMNMGLSYIGQGVPTIFGALARLIDGKRRSTYVPGDAALPKQIGKALVKTANRVPGLSFLSEPYIDAWGREEIDGNIGFRLLQNLLLPGYVNKINETPVDREIDRLVGATSDKGLYPNGASTDMRVGDKTFHLSKTEYTAWGKTQGQIAYRTLEALFKHEDYKKLTDEEKASLVHTVYDYALASAQRDFVKGRPAIKREEEKILTSIEGAEKLGIDVTDFLITREKLSDEDSSQLTREKLLEILTPAKKSEVRRASYKVENTDIKRMSIAELEMNAAQKAYIDEVCIGKLKNPVDYRSEGRFYLSQMSDNQETRYKKVKQRFPNVSETKYYEIVKTANLHDKKADKLAVLEKYGYKDDVAEVFYSIVWGSKKK